MQSEIEQGASATADRAASLTASAATASSQSGIPSAADTRTYRGWDVHYDNPPIPIRSMDWSATSPDYEVDCDQDGFFVCGGAQVHAATYEELIAEIDAHIAGEAE